jgi:hypothetical protein
VYADINGLKMFHEIRGTSDPAKVPVLLHGAISATPPNAAASIPPLGTAPRSTTSQHQRLGRSVQQQ